MIFTARFLRTALLIIASLSFGTALAATDNPADMSGIPSPSMASATSQPAILPSAPDVNAKAYVLIDVDSGDIIASKNMDDRLPPASLTKLMTLYLVSSALKSGVINADDQVMVSKKAWQTGGSRMFIRAGTEVPLNLLMQGIIVDSGNDATMAVAEYVGGSEKNFVAMMNAQAQRLGMTNTHYTDPTGLPAEAHYSSAHDLANLARAIWLQFPEYHAFYGEKWLTYNKIRQPNRNRLLWRYPGTQGMKTGHTKDAGYCLIAEADKDGMRLIAVVLGAPSDEARASDSISLLNYGFRFYSTHLLYQANNTIATPRVWFGETKTIPAGVLEDYYVTLPRNQFAQAKINVEINTDIQAPIQKGQTLGQITVNYQGQVLSQRPLVALAPDAKGGWWRSGTDAASHKFHQWFGSKDEKKTISPSPQTSEPTNNQPPTPDANNTTATAPAPNTGEAN